VVPRLRNIGPAVQRIHCTACVLRFGWCVTACALSLECVVMCADVLSMPVYCCQLLRPALVRGWQLR
jgi:hypothetical protein